MKKKFVVFALLSSIILAFAGCSAPITKEKEIPSKVTEETTAAPETKDGRPAETTESKVSSPIYINMNDMNAEEITKNIWKTANIQVGMSREDYAGHFILSTSDITNQSDNSFFWEFAPAYSTQYISKIDINVATDNDIKVTEIDETTFVNLLVYIDDSDIRTTVFENIVDNFKVLGYEVKPVESDDDNLVKKVTISKNDKEFTLNMTGKYLYINLPVIVAKYEDDGFEITTDVVNTVINENGVTAETILNIINEDGTQKPGGKPNDKVDHPVKKG